MQDTTATHNVLVVPALEAGLMTAPEDRALGRGDVEPILTQDANGVYLLSLCNQGDYRQFAIPYVGRAVPCSTHRMIWSLSSSLSWHAL